MAKNNDAVFEQTRVDVVGAFTTARLLHNDRYQVTHSFPRSAANAAVAAMAQSRPRDQNCSEFAENGQPKSEKPVNTFAIMSRGLLIKRLPLARQPYPDRLVFTCTALLRRARRLE